MKDIPKRCRLLSIIAGMAVFLIYSGSDRWETICIADKVKHASTRKTRRVKKGVLGANDTNMKEDSYFVYWLKDPRKSPALPFCIGKGIAALAYEHDLKIDQTKKGMRIQDIQSQGRDVIVSLLAENLSDIQALKLEVELIAAFGTEATGGFLTNAAIPTGRGGRQRKDIVVPSGLKEKTQLGLKLLKDAVLELAKANPEGIQNPDAVKTFGLQSNYQGGSKDYSVWSTLGILMREGKMKRTDGSRKHKTQADKNQAPTRRLTCAVKTR